MGAGTDVPSIAADESDGASLTHTQAMEDFTMLQRRNLGEPDEVRTFDKGRLEIASLPGMTLGRAILEPGWRWSEHVRPIVGGDSCQVAHAAYVVSGRMHVRMDDGTELDLGPGDAHVVSAGHDAWVVGDEPLVAIDIVGVETFAIAGGGAATA